MNLTRKDQDHDMWQDGKRERGPRTILLTHPILSSVRLQDIAMETANIVKRIATMKSLQTGTLWDISSCHSSYYPRNSELSPKSGVYIRTVRQRKSCLPTPLIQLCSNSVIPIQSHCSSNTSITDHNGTQAKITPDG